MAFLTPKKGDPWLTISRCCCMSLRTTSLIVAATETIFILTVFVFMSVAKALMPGFPFRLPEFVVIEIEIVIQLIMSCVLIFAIIKKRQDLVKAWVWVRGVCIVTEFLMGVLTVFLFQLWVIGLVLSMLSMVALINMLIVRSFGYHMQQREPVVESEVVSVEDLVKSSDSK